MVDSDFVLVSKKLLLRARRMSLAVIGSGKSGNLEPQVGLMQYVFVNGNIYFKTFEKYRKFDYLLERDSVGICIYDKPDYLQLQGKCSLLDLEKNSIEAEKVREAFHSKHPDLTREYTEGKDTRYFVVELTWARLGVFKEYLFEFVDVDVKKLSS